MVTFVNIVNIWLLKNMLKSHVPLECENPSHIDKNSKLYLTHSHLCGPMHIASKNNNKYLITFIDDYPIMCSVY